MFAFFKHTFGVSTVVDALDHLVAAPAWITPGPGGQGFVEVARAVIEGVGKRQGRQSTRTESAFSV